MSSPTRISEDCMACGVSLSIEFHPAVSLVGQQMQLDEARVSLDQWRRSHRRPACNPNPEEGGDDACPTCGTSGPDAFERDFDTGAVEVACGDEFHEEGGEQ